MMRKPIQYQLSEYQPLTGMMPEITVREFKGVNTYDKFSIPDTMFTDIANLDSEDYPTLTTREGYTQIGTTIGTKVLGIGVWKDTQTHAVFNDGTWRYWNGTTWVTVASGLNTTANAYFCNFQGNQSDVCLFFTNGVNGLRKWDGTSQVAFGDAPSNVNFITTFANRLWGASGKELHACALDQPDEWQLFNGTEEDSYVKDMESDRGENINSLNGGMSKLFIGMPNSLHELYGSLPSDFSTRQITDQTGISNNNSLFVQDSVLRFIHKNGIYEYISGGVSPDRSFSDIVDGYFDDIQATSACGTDGDRFFFQINSGEILVYDPRLSTWTVFENISASCFTVFQHQLYVGDNQGRVLRLSGTTDAGSAISFRAVTKPFTANSTAQRQRWIKFWTFWELEAGATLNIYFSETSNGSDWQLLKTVTGTGNKIERVIIPVDKFAISNMVRIKFEGTGIVKLHEHTRQVRLLPLY